MSKIYPVRLDMYKLLIALSEATDLVSPALANHHKQVSYIAYRIGQTLEMGEDNLRDLALAGALHDIGGLSLASRLETLDFEMSEPDHHSVSGAVLLAMFKPFSHLSNIIRFHHQYWDNGRGEAHNNEPVPYLTHILHLADRIAVLINQQTEVLQQVKSIVAKINENKGRMFHPEIADAFQELSIRESFWFDVAAPQKCPMFNDESIFGISEMIEQDMLDLTSLFCRVIDFRSCFTATHSSGVAAIAKVLAAKAGLDAAECKQVQLAGLLHDLGKLVVPQEILEKETPLTKNDYEVIRRHPYYSQRILKTVPGFDNICTWSAYHHERLDGSGYPFHVKGDEIPFGARILSVADTFTALTEVRPYRSGTSSRGTLKFLDSQVIENKLDGDIVSLISQDIETFHGVREKAQSDSFKRHTMFEEEIMKETGM